MLKEFNAEVQELFLRMMVTNAELFVRVTNIFNAENFDRRLRPVAEFMREHSDSYKILPDSTQIKATTGVTIDTVPDLDEGHYEWFMTEFEAFTRRQELERAIMASADLLEKGDYDPVEKLIKDMIMSSVMMAGQPIKEEIYETNFAGDYNILLRLLLEVIKHNYMSLLKVGATRIKVLND